jgi:hypothetical protein
MRLPHIFDWCALVDVGALLAHDLRCLRCLLGDMLNGLRAGLLRSVLGRCVVGVGAALRRRHAEGGAGGPLDLGLGSEGD